MRGKCTVYILPLLPSIARRLNFRQAKRKSLIWDDSRRKKFTVHSRMKISTNPSSTLTTSRCLVAIVMTKMKTNALWKKGSIAILQKLEVDNRILQGLPTVDQAFVGLVIQEG